MRLESTSGNETKVWLTDDEIEELRRSTASLQDDLIIQLGACVGLLTTSISLKITFEIPFAFCAIERQSNESE